MLYFFFFFAIDGGAIDMLFAILFSFLLFATYIVFIVDIDADYVIFIYRFSSFAIFD